jgi:hypothetical protein
MSCTVPVAAGVDVDGAGESVELDDASEELEESELHAAAARSSGATVQARARRTCVDLSGIADEPRHPSLAGRFTEAQKMPVMKL